MHPTEHTHPIFLSNTADSDSGISIPLGIFIGLLASFVQSAGLAIQRRSHVLDAQLPESNRRVEHKRPLWLLGFAIFLTSNVFGSVIQIASLPVVILAPLGAVSLLWNALFSRILFRLPLLLGTALIAGGAALIAVYGIVPETTRSLEELMALFARHAFIAWFCIEGFVLAVCLVVTHIVEFSFTRSYKAMCLSSPSGSGPSSLSASPSSTPPLSPTPLPSSIHQHPSVLTTGLTEELTTTGLTERTPLIDPKLRSTESSLSGSAPSSLSLDHHKSHTTPRGFSPRTPFFLALAYAAASGTLSGLCLIFAKSGVELLILTLRGANQFHHWEAWVLVGGLVAFALGQLWYLNRGLRFADPAVVCPSAFCFYNFSSIINGVIYYDQLVLLSAGNIALVVLGMFLLLAGVWAVSVQAGADVRSWEEGDDKAEGSVEGQEGLLDAESTDRGLEDSARVEEGLLMAPSYTADQKSRSRSKSRIQVIAPPIDRQSHSEGAQRSNSGSVSMHTLYPLPGDSPPHLQPSTRSHSHAHSQTLSLSQPHSGLSTHLSSPPSQGGSFLLSPTISTSRSSRRRSTYGDPSMSRANRASLSLPHPSLSPPLRGGLSIGLSPASPGFSLVPRSRVSGSDSGPGFGDVVDAAVTARKGRVVSENGLRRWWEARRDDADENGRGEECERDESGAGRDGKAKMRWGWLRHVFAGRQNSREVQERP
ncbi:hypothetical protein SERLA73DRAFT_76328 [Serpula lacrymans var. lacrymans S7.3]|uniref:DUF803 domain-containing protein n=2 Tax=Serpula lacrymans var. lacrymans TaxID=341189 RepID=F8Q6W9_SERL3|nr:uncharacterized protein SERLADRAFT_441121 [Serpula lacrymans var. lacrymans S7.9]EGN96357.1 hypothetical protein SERLA73DRAFT_76328 [Serpula lacrymans var. lacrymans S7.3]EGO21895.1 hypothetical protein SERLADRAFT_441121 [Serpula lacrymans var. lacrymans S7.9]